MYILHELEPEMIKLLKMASYLSIALAVMAIVIVGIGLTRDNDTDRERAEFLAKPTVIDSLREIKNLPDTKKNKVSPLVTQSIDFALRIDPPPPPRPVVPVIPKRPTGSKAQVPKKQPIVDVVTPPKNVTFKLLATCRYENYPEKSLAMIDITSKGPQWVRQGQIVGHQEIHQINDGNIEVYQNGKINGILEVPKKTTVSSLLKSSGGETITATVSTSVPAKTPVRPTAGGTAGSRNTAVTRRPTINNRPARRLPARPTAMQARKANEQDVTEISNILDGLDSIQKDQKNGSEAGMDELMKTVMKMIEESSSKDNKEANKTKKK